MWGHCSGNFWPGAVAPKESAVERLSVVSSEGTGCSVCYVHLPGPPATSLWVSSGASWAECLVTCPHPVKKLAVVNQEWGSPQGVALHALPAESAPQVPPQS